MEQFLKMRVKRVVQETKIIAIADVEIKRGHIEERRITLDANERPVPVPYSEEP